MSAPIVETIRPDDPTLAVRLKVLPPIVGQMYNGSPKHGDWTLDLVERTCIEFRAAGAWDQSRVELSGHPASLSCEILAGRGDEAMPWGWRPSEGSSADPTPSPRVRLGDRELRDAIPAALGSRVLHGVLLLALLLLEVASHA